MAIAETIIGPIVAGDSAPDLVFNIKREDGTVPDLTGATVTLRILNPATDIRTNDSGNSCTILDAVNAQVKYVQNVAGTDFPNAGVYRCRLRIVYDTNHRESGRLRVEVVEDV